MKYRLFGRTGLRVSELCLGTMTFGDQWQGWGMSTDREECRAIFDAFVAAGGNFIDTANGYNGGDSERFVGELIAAERERFVVATKYTMSMRPDDPNGGGNHRKNLLQSLHASLRRLKTDYVDIFWLHVWDNTTPCEEFMRALDDVVRAGKVLYVGVSDTPAWVVSRAQTLAELRGWSPFAGVQLEYNLLERTSERELLPMARALDLGITAWSPLAMGLLTGKYAEPAIPQRPDGHRGRLDLSAMAPQGRLTEQNLAVAREVAAIARRHEMQPALLALSWLRQKGIIPIIGARHHQQMIENLKCTGVELSAEVMTELEAIGRPTLGFPHDLITSVQGAVFGQTADRLMRHRPAN